MKKEKTDEELKKIATKRIKEMPVANVRTFLKVMDLTLKMKNPNRNLLRFSFEHLIANAFVGRFPSGNVTRHVMRELTLRSEKVKRCKECGNKLFEETEKTKNYCSKRCGDRARLKKWRNRKKTEIL